MFEEYRVKEDDTILEFNDPVDKNYDFSKSLYQMFQCKVKESPDSIATVYKSGNTESITLTYAMLNKAIDKMAEAIYESLQTTGNRVGVYLERSPYTIISILAIWKTGNIYVPIDMAFPEEYINYIINDADINFILTQSKFSDRLSKTDIKILDIDFIKLDNSLAEGNAEYKHSDKSHPGRVSYILYTSGTTGHPKGVIHRQYNLINRFNWFWESYPFCKGDVCFQRTNVNFNPSMFEFFIGLLKGFPTVIVSDDIVKDIYEMVKVIEEYKVTVIQFVPSLLKRVLEAQNTVEKLVSIRICVTCGEPLSLELYKNFSTFLPKSTLVNDYGSSEMNGVLFFDNSQYFDKDEKLPELKAIANIKAYIMNSDNRECAANETGVLFIQCPFLADGYVNLPEETKKKFIKVSMKGKENVQLYNTGDLAERNSNGGIRIVGRADQQVKIRGIRIELPAVEHAIVACKEIEECCVIAKEIRDGVKILVAFVVLKEYYHINDTEIRSMVASILPEYMVPSQIIRMKFLPRTPNGKVKRQELEEYFDKLVYSDTKEHNIKNTSVDDMKRIAANILLRDINSIDETSSFRDLGFDSLTIVDFLNTINSSYSTQIQVSDLFSHSTIKELTEIINKNSAINEREKQSEQLQDKAVNPKEKIAIVGISCRFPGADNVEELWDNILNGRDTVGKISNSRWDVDKYFDKDRKSKGKYITKKAGMLSDVDYFDGSFFQIVPEACEKMDPQQRLCLEECYKALEDAGFSEKELNNKKVGIYVGAREGDYKNLVGYDEIDSSLTLGAESALMAARLSYYLNLKGAAITVDTACSSSMTALHLACRSIEAGDSEMALVCGVNVMCTPALLIQSSKMGILSPTGCIRAFDNDADGTLISEGIGVVVLKKLGSAVKDKDRIYGVIEATGINQDGKSNGITAPNAESQEELMRSVYRDNHISPEEISYFECHGTGTKLGDPIEVQAIANVFKNVDKKITLGSLKTNIGHTFTCSGIAGVIKILLAMKYGTIPPVANFHTLNEHISIENMPLQINDKAMNWNVTPKMAAINSFGISGTNVHMVIREYQSKEEQKEWKQGYYLIPLSGKRKSAIENKKKELLAWLVKKSGSYTMNEVAYTLQKGRSHFKYREAYIVKDVQELCEILKDVEEREYSFGNKFVSENGKIHYFKKEENDVLTQDAQLKEQLLILARRYTDGQEIDWIAFNEKNTAKIISMPTYPFEKEHYWIVDRKQEEKNKKSLCLISKDVSTENEKIFVKYISKYSEIVSGHCVEGKIIFPASAIVEMVFEAASELMNGTCKGYIKELYLLRTIELYEEESSIFVKLEKKEQNLIFTFSSGADDKIYANGIFVIEDKKEKPEKQDINVLRNSLEECFNKEECYNKFRTFGLEYEGSYKPIKELYRSDSKALAFYMDVDDADDTTVVTLPNVLDGIMQAELGLVIEKKSEGTRLPYILQGIRTYGKLTKDFAVYVVKENSEVRLSAMDMQGNVLLSIDNFIVKNKVAKKSELLAESNDSSRKMLCFRDKWTEYENEEIEIYSSDTLLIIGKENETEEIIRTAELLENKLFIKKFLFTDNYKQGTEKCYYGESLSKEDYITASKRLGLAYCSGIKILFYKKATESYSTKEEALQTEQLAKELLIISQCLAEGYFGKNSEILFAFAGNFSDVYSSAVAGFLKSLSFEIASPRFKVLAFQEAETKSLADIVINEAFNIHNGIEEVRYSKDKRYKKSIEEVNIFEKNKNLKFTQEGVTLITGGAGHLGLLTAKMVAECFAGTIVLVGRSCLTEDKKQKITKIAGNNIVYMQADIGDRESVQKLIQNIIEKNGNIRRIFHSAGIIRDKLVKHKSIQDIEDVLNPKVKGLLYLDEFTREQPIEIFAVFSSIAAVLGNTGQEDYAFANGFMDSFIERRNEKAEKGLCQGMALSVNWPLWQGEGMQVPEATFQLLKNQFGLDSLPEDVGMDVLYHNIKNEITRCIVTVGNEDKLRKYFKEQKLCGKKKELLKVDKQVIIQKIKQVIESVTKMPMDRIGEKDEFDSFGIDSIMLVDMEKLLSEELGESTQNVFLKKDTVVDVADYLIENKIGIHYQQKPQTEVNIENFESPEDAGELGKLIKEVIESVTKIPVDRIGDTDEFDSFGIDSIMLVDMEKLLSDRIGESTQNVFMKSGTVKDAVSYLLEQNIGIQKCEQSIVQEDDIVLVGMACRFPKSNNVKQLWYNLANGINCISKVEHTNYYAGLIEGKDLFDPLFFHIAPKEAAYIIPQERLMLEVVWEALEDSGYSKKKLKALKKAGKRVGVFMGAMYEHYQCLAQNEEDRAMLAGSSYWSIANRVSFFLDTNGPSMAIDTACSSSLTAVHLAIESMKNNECDIAIVGGVNLNLVMSKYEGLKLAHMLGSKSQSMSLSNGDGYIPSEGVGVVILTKSSQAIEDNDHIYCVIKESVIGHIGKSKAYKLPEKEAQKDLICNILKKSNIKPEDVSLYEAAANGSSVGDAVEINGLIEAFQELNVDKSECVIGTVKSNIGHLEAASGMSQLIKVALQMKYKKLIPSINVEKLNSDIQLEHTPFYINREYKDWKQKNGKCLYALINSFGAGGSNACILVQNYNVPVVRKEYKESKFLFLFSAVTKERLKAVVSQMLQFLEDEFTGNILDVAYTLSRREPMHNKIAIIARNKEELISSLKKYLQDDIYYDNSILFTDVVKRKKFVTNSYEQAAIDWLEHKDLSFELWEGGRLTELPHYPFENDSYWIEDGIQAEMVEKSVKQSNTMTLDIDTHSQDIENVLLEAVGKLLKIPVNRIDLNESFDRYGMDSLVSKKLLEYINRTYHLNISFKALYENYSINGLKSVINDLVDNTNYQQADERIEKYDALYYLDNFILTEIEENKMQIDEAVALREEILSRLGKEN
ncbi:MAG: SDR family NAD(P)-dependent oxidoreductase [Acutalibacteraceae bacterium]|nr:SDR family NAD(P)-dependent oxidoreductase [Acutalibacteraceae bacterium]